MMIAQLLQQQLEQLAQLEQMLLQEREVLEHNDPQALGQLTSLKQQILKKIEQSDQQLAQSPNFIEQRKAGQWQDEVDQIHQTLAHCQELNNINGHIIQQSSLVVERLKSSLLESRTKTTMTYDAKGKTQGGLSSLGIKA